jgi:hypothetical protein
MTATLFVCAGIAFAISTQPTPSRLMHVAAVILSLTITVTGLTKLLDLTAGWLPNIDELLFASKTIECA